MHYKMQIQLYMFSLHSFYLTSWRQCAVKSLWGSQTFDIYSLMKKVHGCDRLNYYLRTVHLMIVLMLVRGYVFPENFRGVYKHCYFPSDRSHPESNIVALHILSRAFLVSVWNFRWAFNSQHEPSSVFSEVIVINNNNIGWESDSTEVWSCFTALRCHVVVSWRKRRWDGLSERMRQHDRQRERKEGESCCDSLFTLYEWSFSSHSAF